jgi:hypothetical protein
VRFLLALCVLPLAANALAVPTVWAEKSVWVLGCSTPKWDGLVEGTVDEFNGVLPESASRLAYRRGRSSSARCRQRPSRA